MIDLYKHQREAVDFLTERPGAMLAHEMGLGKSRSALVAAYELFASSNIDRVLVLLPKAVAFAWTEELTKLEMADVHFNLIVYNPKKEKFFSISQRKDGPPIALVSYGLLPQERHVKRLTEWCFAGKGTALICDESSFLKNRTAKQTKGAAKISEVCTNTWLLTGTPIANSPLDLYGQALVMSGSNGPLRGFKSYYQFQARFAQTQPMRFGNGRAFQKVTGYQNLEELQRKFAPYVSRVEKKDALDLPPKSYSVREVELTPETWKVYTELKNEAMLALTNKEAHPEPNAAVRILRLCQLTSGHVGGIDLTQCSEVSETTITYTTPMLEDVSTEKLDYLVESILTGELSNEQAIIVWCRWRRERERLASVLRDDKNLYVYQIFGGQPQKDRDFSISGFQTADKGTNNRNILLAQPHAGGYGLTLTAAKTAVYLSNDFSYTTRIQSEDRCHRIGQVNPVTYLDVLAVGPKGQKTVDHAILEALKTKKSLAEMTCAAWREVLA